MLPVKTSPAKETRRRTGVNGSDVGDVESHHSNEGSPQKSLLGHAHHPSEKPLVCPLTTSPSLSISHHLLSSVQVPMHSAGLHVSSRLG